MSGLLFSGPNLAVVAYCEVDYLEGASTVTNSGVTTTRLELGVFQVTLPTNLSQSQSQDLIFVQNLRTPPDEIPQGHQGRNIMVDDSDPVNKVVRIFRFNPTSGSPPTPIDVNFTFFLLRTTVAPPFNLPP